MAVDFDRLKNTVLAFVRTALPRVDYYALYACTVSSQNSDGTLELKPDAPSVPGLSSVKYKPGLPGMKATVSGNARVLLGFENGDPSKPYAIGWDGGVGTVDKMVINATAIEVGNSPSDYTVKGTTLCNNATTALQALNISNAAIPPATTLPTAIAAITALIAELNVFSGSSGLPSAFTSSNLSSKTKVE